MVAFQIKYALLMKNLLWPDNQSSLCWVSQWNTILALNDVIELKAEFCENNCFLFIWGMWQERDMGVFTLQG